VIQQLMCSAQLSEASSSQGKSLECTGGLNKWVCAARLPLGQVRCARGPNGCASAVAHVVPERMWIDLPLYAAAAEFAALRCPRPTPGTFSR
jgi:hypothetical protein